VTVTGSSGFCKRAKGLVIYKIDRLDLCNTHIFEHLRMRMVGEIHDDLLYSKQSAVLSSLLISVNPPARHQCHSLMLP
jgi:hypothetical protein